MSKLPIILGAECVKALEQISFVVDHQRGSHIIPVCEDSRTTIFIPDHKELDRGTLRSIIRQVGLSMDEFIELLWSSNLHDRTPNHGIVINSDRIHL